MHLVFANLGHGQAERLSRGHHPGLSKPIRGFATFVDVDRLNSICGLRGPVKKNAGRRMPTKLHAFDERVILGALAVLRADAESIFEVGRVAGQEYLRPSNDICAGRLVLEGPWRGPVTAGRSFICAMVASVFPRRSGAGSPRYVRTSRARADATRLRAYRPGP